MSARRQAPEPVRQKATPPSRRRRRPQPTAGQPRLVAPPPEARARPKEVAAPSKKEIILELLKLPRRRIPSKTPKLSAHRGAPKEWVAARCCLRCCLDDGARQDGGVLEHGHDAGADVEACGGSGTGWGRAGGAGHQVRVGWS